MTLESGARLGPYEIIAPLGAGGMGEVPVEQAVEYAAPSPVIVVLNWTAGLKP